MGDQNRDRGIKQNGNPGKSSSSGVGRGGKDEDGGFSDPSSTGQSGRSGQSGRTDQDRQSGRTGKSSSSGMSGQSSSSDSLDDDDITSSNR